MMIISNRLIATPNDLDRSALRDAADRCNMTPDDAARVICAYLNEIEAAEIARRDFEKNGQDRW